MMNVGDNRGARRAFWNTSIEMIERSFRNESPQLTLPLYNLAELHTQLGNFDLARGLYERELAIRQQASAPQPQQIAGRIRRSATC